MSSWPATFCDYELSYELFTLGSTFSTSVSAAEQIPEQIN